MAQLLSVFLDFFMFYICNKIDILHIVHLHVHLTTNEYCLYLCFVKTLYFFIS